MMTLREFGQSIATFWENYVTQITTQNVLDWSIGNLFLSIVLFIVVMMIVSIIIGALTVVLGMIAAAYNKTGLPYLWVRLDKRFGYFISGLIMLVVTFVLLGLIGVLLALLEMAVG